MYIYRFVSRKKEVKETAKKKLANSRSFRARLSIFCLYLHCSIAIRSEYAKMDERSIYVYFHQSRLILISV